MHAHNLNNSLLLFVSYIGHIAIQTCCMWLHTGDQP